MPVCAFSCVVKNQGTGNVLVLAGGSAETLRPGQTITVRMSGSAVDG